MIYRYIKKKSEVNLPDGQTWTVTRKIAVSKKDLRTLKNYLTALHIVLYSWLIADAEFCWFCPHNTLLNGFLRNPKFV